MNKIKKILFALVLLVLFNINLDASVKENGVYNEDTYIVGITKFNGVSISEEVLEVANSNFENFITNYNIKDFNYSIYYYSKVTDSWYYLDSEDNFIKLDENKTNELVNNLDIFYVNNKEKIIEFEYNNVVDENSITSEDVIFENNAFKVPSTTLNFKFKSNDKTLLVETKYDSTTKDKYYGEYYIPKNINVLDSEGNYLTTLITDINDLIITDSIKDKYEKEGYTLGYFSDSELVDFTEKVEDDENTIKQKYFLIGTILENENVKSDELIITYSGNIHVNKDTLKSYIELELKVPLGEDVSNVKVNNLPVTFEDNIGKIILEVNDLEDKNLLIEWNETEGVQYLVQFKDAYFTKLVRYYNVSPLAQAVLLGTEEVINGETIKGYINDYITIKGYYTDSSALDKYDINTKVEDHTDLYVDFYYNPRVSSESDITLIKSVPLNTIIDINPLGLANKKVKITVKFDKEVVFDENNYIKIKGYTEEDSSFNDNELTIQEFNGGEISLEVKLTDYEASKIVFLIEENGKEHVTSIDIDVEEAAFESGGKLYLSLKDAIDDCLVNEDGSCSKNKTITMLRDTTITEAVEIDNRYYTIKLDLGGHTLTSTDTYGIKLEGYYTKLEIDNGTLEVNNESVNTYAIYVNNGADDLTGIELTIGSKAVINSNKNGMYIDGIGTVLSLKGKLTITGSGNALTVERSTKIKLEGAAIESKNGYALKIYLANKVDLINSNIVSNTGVFLMESTLNIENSTIEVNGVRTSALSDHELNGTAILIYDLGKVIIDNKSSITSANTYPIMEINYPGTVEEVSEVSGYTKTKVETSDNEYYYVKNND